MRRTLQKDGMISICGYGVPEVGAVQGLPHARTLPGLYVRRASPHQRRCCK